MTAVILAFLAEHLTQPHTYMIGFTVAALWNVGV